jgi:transcription-repair coupling factor (superfamily II helicase)
MEDLGAGFTLATHDLEIRRAGELLGEARSGQIQEVGFNLYMDLLKRAVDALEAGRTPELDRPLDHGAEIDLGFPELLPSDYLPDVHQRLLTYKRIASAKDPDTLRELEVEMIDRFGLLPVPAKNLLEIHALKLRVQPLGIRKLEAGTMGGRVIFGPEPQIDPPPRRVGLIQSRPKEYKLDGGDKFRSFRDLSNPTLRTAQVAHILDQISG